MTASAYAAPLEPAIAELWERIQVEYHANQLAVVRSLGPGALRRGLGERRAADIIWLLNHPNTWIQVSSSWLEPRPNLAPRLDTI